MVKGREEERTNEAKAHLPYILPSKNPTVGNKTTNIPTYGVTKGTERQTSKITPLNRFKQYAYGVSLSESQCVTRKEKRNEWQRKAKPTQM